MLTAADVEDAGTRRIKRGNRRLAVSVQPWLPCGEVVWSSYDGRGAVVVVLKAMRKDGYGRSLRDHQSSVKKGQALEGA